MRKTIAKFVTINDTFKLIDEGEGKETRYAVESVFGTSRNFKELRFAKQYFFVQIRKKIDRFSEDTDGRLE